MQYFKGDDIELKFYASGESEFDALDVELDAFYAGAYTCQPLSEMIYDSNLAPLTNAMRREIYIDSWPEIAEAFTFAGSFESYLTVFNKIFTDDVDVTFTVPGPGHLQIEIEATGLQLDTFVAAEVVDDDYEYSEIVEDIGTSDNILFRTVKGFRTQYELEQMLYELVPAGIYTEISLTLGV